ncbi:MAG: HD domain-containing protein [Lachnospiraceae bacterium]|nr:HD domain-containing protein [Lachnospiraceae bacterium]
MERINRILTCSMYQKYLNQNNLAEAERRFCHHNMGHFLDVARIACILNIEEGYGQDRELIYAAALLHDIGRWKQYKDGTPHEMASANLAPEILSESGFSVGESGMILEAIKNHRNSTVKEEKSLQGLLYRADKLSRPCFACRMEKECDWKKGKKNLKLLI